MPGRFLYSLYGLKLESNLPLPGLSPTEGPGADVKVVLGQQLPATIKQTEPWYVCPFVDKAGAPILTTWKAPDSSAYHFAYCDGTEFIVDHGGTLIHGSWREEYSLENTCYYLVGQIAAFVLRLRGVVSLHGSSVLIGDRALTISGNSGSGKSTTAAAFANRGFRVLTEDVSALLEKDGHLYVQLGYPRINLWPDTVDLMYGTQHGLRRIVPTWDKLYLDLEERSQFHETVASLGAIYVLETRISSSSAPFIEALSPSESLVLLLTNAHGRYLVDTEMREREFTLASRIVQQIPVRRVVPHTDLARLDRMVDLILDDFGQVVSSANAPYRVPHVDN